MPRIPFAHLLLSLLLLWGCAAQRGQIAKPDWAEREVAWDGTGLTVNAYGENDYSRDNKNSERAEENAFANARKLIARELAKAYLKASKDSISEDEAASRLEAALGTPIEKLSKYDPQTGTFFVQIYVPASRLLSVVNSTFNTNLKLNSDGSLTK